MAREGGAAKECAVLDLQLMGVCHQVGADSSRYHEWHCMWDAPDPHPGYEWLPHKPVRMRTPDVCTLHLWRYACKSHSPISGRLMYTLIHVATNAQVNCSLLFVSNRLVDVGKSGRYCLHQISEATRNMIEAMLLPFAHHYLEIRERTPE